MGRITWAIQTALGVNEKHPVWQAMISRSQKERGICEIMIGDENRPRDLKSTSAFLQCDEKGRLSILQGIERPAAGTHLIVVPASRKDDSRIAFWGFLNELKDVSEHQVTIGSDLAPKRKKEEEPVQDLRPSKRHRALAPRPTKPAPRLVA